MPPRKRTSSVLNGDAHEPVNGSETTDHDDQLSLDEQAEAAEAEAAEADALAAAARARTRALRLRRQAEAAAAKAAAAEVSAAPVAVAPAPVSVPADVEAANAVEVDAPTPTADAEDIDAEDIDAEDIDAEDADDAEPVRRRRLALHRPSLKVVAAAVVILLSLGFLGASGYMIWQHRQVAAEQQRSAEFAAAARQGVVTLMSLDFNHADEDVKRILDNTTGDFKKDFAGQVDEFAKVAKDSKVVTVATVNATAVDKMTRDTATVLVAVNTNVSNTASKEQTPRSWRLKVDVARDGGQIKLAKVEFVP